MSNVLTSIGIGIVDACFQGLLYLYASLSVDLNRGRAICGIINQKIRALLIVLANLIICCNG